MICPLTQIPLHHSFKSGVFCDEHHRTFWRVDVVQGYEVK